eukprot:9577364-Ditylum_brightwellii.AAC.1
MEGFKLSFEGPLDMASRAALQKTLFRSLGKSLLKKDSNRHAQHSSGKINSFRAVAAGPWPILLEGPTSAGTTM